MRKGNVLFLERQTAGGYSVPGAGASCPTQRRHRAGPWETQPAAYPTVAHGEGFGIRGYSKSKSCVFKYWSLVDRCTLRQGPILNYHRVWYRNWMYFALAQCCYDRISNLVSS